MARGIGKTHAVPHRRGCHTQRQAPAGCRMLDVTRVRAGRRAMATQMCVSAGWFDRRFGSRLQVCEADHM